MVEAAEEAATPNKDDDFFSSWDKPAIKRPTPPPSRTATPPVIGRTASPLTPGAGNGIDRSKSPLSSAASTPAAAPTPTASRITKSSELRAAGPRKSGVLGARKGKLNAVKGGAIDFDAVEKKAKEEAERIAKLGYDPDAEADKKKDASAVKKAATPAASDAKSAPRSSGDVERLGLGMARLGFGQTAAAAPAKAAPKRMGFGAMGAAPAVGACFP